jgi:sodium-dependent dicarboxylate transporter 2/3/5
MESFVGTVPLEGAAPQTTFRFVCLVLGPLALFPFLFNPLDAEPRVNRCAGVTIWIAIWWMSEALPISFTSLLPLVLFPLLGVLQAKVVALSYFNDLTFLFIGTVIFACAMERWSFHKRFALRILMIVGTNPTAVLLGFMTCTYLLSWWLSNSATAALMLPVVRAVLESLTESGSPANSVETTQFCKAVLIAVAYASSIGGISTLTGTGTNLVFAGQVNDLFPKYDGISFAQWMMYAVPLSLSLMLVMLVIFYFQYVRYSTHRIDTYTVRQRYNALGKISLKNL